MRPRSFEDHPIPSGTRPPPTASNAWRRSRASRPTSARPTRCSACCTSRRPPSAGLRAPPAGHAVPLRPPREVALVGDTLDELLAVVRGALSPPTVVAGMRPETRAPRRPAAAAPGARLWTAGPPTCAENFACRMPVTEPAELETRARRGCPMTAARAGTASLGRPSSPSTASAWARCGSRGRATALDPAPALELGVNLIDTADTYGGGQRGGDRGRAPSLPRRPRDRHQGGSRCRPTTSPSPTAGPSTCARRASAACGGCASTRSPLPVPQPGSPRTAGESIGALVQLRDEGKVRDDRGLERVRRATRGGSSTVPIVSVQNLYHLEGRQFEHGIAAVRGAQRSSSSPAGRCERRSPSGRGPWRRWPALPRDSAPGRNRPGCSRAPPSWRRSPGPAPWSTWRRTSPPRR